MARKELKYTVTDAGRDKGKAYLLTEMKPRMGHAWATRALFAVMNGGIDIPDNILHAGWAGIATLGVKSLGKMSVYVAQPLLDELFDCVQIIPDPSKPNVVRSLIEDDTEEVMTLFKLQYEVLNLHVNFSTPDVQ